MRTLEVKALCDAILDTLLCPTRIEGGETENYISSPTLSLCKVVEDLEQRTIKKRVHFFSKQNQ